MREKEKWGSLSVMKKDGTGDRNVERSSLCGHVKITAMSDTLAPQQLGLVPMPVAPISTR